MPWAEAGAYQSEASQQALQILPEVDSNKPECLPLPFISTLMLYMRERL